MFHVLFSIIYPSSAETVYTLPLRSVYTLLKDPVDFTVNTGHWLPVYVP